MWIPFKWLIFLAENGPGGREGQRIWRSREAARVKKREMCSSKLIVSLSAKVRVSYHEFHGYATDNEREQQPASATREGSRREKVPSISAFLVEVEEGRVGPLS